ncbi:MAG: exo-alpha-sialidase [Armatimonadota bacterium]
MDRREFLMGVGGGIAAGAASAACAGSPPPVRSELIFPLGHLHSHGSCVVQCPNGDLLACWYLGSGERRADDVRIMGARKRPRDTAWSEPFLMADVPGFPDCNPCMIIDPQERLWLFWPVIQANEWHTALLKCRISRNYQRRGAAPVWAEERVVHLKPGPEFTQIVQEAVERDLRRVDTFPEAQRPAVREYLERRRANAADRYFNRLGWMPRVHPYILDGRRMILPLYSDGFDFSLMAITDDWGETWTTSTPLVGDGPVQPALARKRDGTLAAFMRDNGGPPQRLLYSESRDGGLTWSTVRDSEILNPGSGVDVVTLRDGRWVLINNDTERGRHSLLVSISDDDGKTWRWNRHLERDVPDGTGFHYPSIIEAKDGALHATYTYSLPERAAQKDVEGRPLREAIRHARFGVDWVMRGD